VKLNLTKFEGDFEMRNPPKWTS